jgi:hypothetical protein
MGGRNYHNESAICTLKFDTRHEIDTPSETGRNAMLDSDSFNRIRADLDVAGPSEGTQFERAPQHIHCSPHRESG